MLDLKNICFERDGKKIENGKLKIPVQYTTKNIHGTHTQIYVDAINSFLEEGIK